MNVEDDFAQVSLTLSPYGRSQGRSEISSTRYERDLRRRFYVCSTFPLERASSVVSRAFVVLRLEFFISLSSQRPSISPASSQHIVLRASLEEFFPPAFHWPATLIFQFLPISLCFPRVWDLSVRFMFVPTPLPLPQWSLSISASHASLGFPFALLFHSLSFSLSLSRARVRETPSSSSLRFSLSFLPRFSLNLSPLYSPSLLFNFIRDYFSVRTNKISHCYRHACATCFAQLNQATV